MNPDVSAIPAHQLLDVWERGRLLPPVRQALLLLEAASPQASAAELAWLPTGRRDALLLALRELTFGPQLASKTACPACAAPLELALEVADVRAEPPPLEEPLAVTVGEQEIRFRLPTSADLLPATGRDAALAGERLLQACLVDVTPPLQGPLPAATTAAITALMAEADPQAEIWLALACAACGHQWQSLLDITTFFWQEIDAWAQRTLREIHVLASAYGWNESDILQLSPWRRQAYLELVLA
jgi:hypothetical protein